MTSTDVFQGHFIKSTQFVQKGSLLLLAAAASLVLAYRHHNGTMLGAALALCTVVVPSGCLLARRMRDKARHRETEDLLMIQTRTYLRNQEPARKKVESDIEILARTIDGRKLPTQDFRKIAEIAPVLPVGDPVLFDALPRRYAIRNLYDQRFADLAAALPEPERLPLGELLPAPAKEEFGS
ncbi:MAG TPA: hypothetical protein VN924_29025 [Bryobacteraceae bacterium]|jgi:hypothetical protein|nr:hypothetical protein [Bryobacteraceae bacterium]